MAANTTRGRIRDYIKRKFGHPTVHVELEDDQLQDAVEEALAWFAGLVGIVHTDSLTANGTGEYDVNDDVSIVTEVVPTPSNLDSLVTPFAWADVELTPMAYGYRISGLGRYSELLQYMQYLEQAKRLVGADFDWEWDRAARKLRLSPAELVSGTVIYYYTPKSLSLDNLTPYEVRLIRQYAYAEAMEVLGQIRSKYSELPSSTGGVTLNGETLLANAEALRESLEEKAKMLRKPLGFIIG